MIAMANPISDTDDSMFQLLQACSPMRQGHDGGNMLDQAPSLQIEELEEWSHIEDMGIRRRIQNRNAQRLFRARRRGIEQGNYRDEFAFPPTQALQGPATPQHTPNPISTSPYVSAYSPPATVQMSAIENQGNTTGDRDPPRRVPVTESGYFSPPQTLNPRTPAPPSLPSSHEKSQKLPSPAFTHSPSPYGDGRTTLHLAAENGNLNIVQVLLQRLPNISAQDFQGQTALHVAVQRGHVQIVQELLVSDPDFACEPHAHRPRCAKTDCQQCASLAVLTVDIQDIDGRTALHLAAETGNEHIAELLLQSGAMLNRRDKSGLTPLHIAGIHGFEKIVKLLLDYQADYLEPVRIE